MALALAAGATFVARTVDLDLEHLGEVLRQAAAHRGTAFVEVYQNCITFNDGAFSLLTDRETRDEHRLLLVHGQPLVFGSGRSRGIRFRGAVPEVVTLGAGGASEADLTVHDATAIQPGMAQLLAALEPPGFPVPLGVFRAVEQPTYDRLNDELEATARTRQGTGNLAQLLESGTTWSIE